MSAPTTTNGTSDSSAPIDLRSPTRPIHAGVILLGGVTEVLDISPIDLLGGLTPEFVSIFPDEVLPAAIKEQAVNVQIHYVNETGKSAKLTSNMTIEVTDTFETCPPLDITLIGATISNYTPTETELAFLRTTFNSPTNQAFLTICAGMLPPLQAGLLQGRRATAPRPMLAQLRKDAPGVEWTERRWQQDGKLWTSGTLLNGLDMMRAWAGSVWGEEKKGEGKEERLVDFTMDLGGWPVRDVEYRDDVQGPKKWDGVEIPLTV